MGRKRSLVGVMLREWDAASRRAASAARRQGQRESAMAARAYEREVVRQERMWERERAAERRAEERARIAAGREAEREEAKRTKEEEREAQLAAWRLEVEEHQERDRVLLAIANDGPEVDDRAALFEGLAARQDYVPQSFAEPAAVPPDMRRVDNAEREAQADADERLRRFEPDLARFRQPLVAAVAAVGVGTAAMAGVVVGSVGLIALLAVHALRGSAARTQRQAERDKLSARIRKDLDALTTAVVEQAHVASQARAAQARAQYDAACAAEAQAFAAQEEARLANVRQLLDGDASAMREALADLLPLELPVPAPSEATVVDAGAVRVDVDVPEPAALEATRAALLASGKPSYKKKTATQLREEYRRLVAGVALRHALEVMLSLPTVGVVEVHAWRTALDPARGVQARSEALVARYDFAALAPLRLPDLDPTAALQHFEHKLSIDKA